MFKKILLLMQEKIRTREYIVTIHADEEMDAEDFSIFDIENCILNGEVAERQRDKETSEWKYIISGKSLANKKMKVVSKIGIMGKFVIITVFSD